MHADAGAAADEPLGVHLCNILHILRMHDRFESIFQRWSVCRQRDRQQLVLTLAENAKLSHSVIAAICMLYPSRIAGPYVSKNVFTVELLDEAVHFEAQAEPALSHKRKRAAGEGEGAVEAIGSDVAQCLQSSNSSAVYVARTLTGQDGGGDWMTYELSASDRIDLSFMPNVYSGPNSDTIKHLYIQMGLVVALHCKLYRAEERRVVSGWDIVPVYRASGMFTAVRTWRS